MTAAPFATDPVADCVAAGVFRSVDPPHIARVLWAAGYEGAVDPESNYDDLLAGAAPWFFAH
jgi:hypothetical protein